MRTHGRSRVLVLGGGYAGMLAAARVARQGLAEVTLVDQRPRFVQRIRLHEALAGAEVPELSYAPLLARRKVAFLQARVAGIDPAAQEARVMVDGAEQRLGYDQLIVALGSVTAPGVTGAAAHAVALDDPQTIARTSLQLRALAAAGGRVLVVGGGLTAIESVAELAAQLPGLRVELVTSGALGATFSAGGAQHLRTSLAALGVTWHERTAVAALEAGQAHLVDGGSLRYDCCVWAGGFTAPTLLAEAGLPVDAQGRVLVTPMLQVANNPTIFVAGDSAAASDGGHAIRMGCVSALPLGAHTGENVAAALAGRPLKPLQFGFPGRNVSLGRHDGLIQFTDRRDHPSERILTGRPAAMVKESVCRMTLEAVRGELHTGIPFYRWLSGERWGSAPTPSA